MLSAFVLRLRPDTLAHGELVGEVEDVETGLRVVVRSAEELFAFLRGTATSPGVGATNDEGDHS